MRNNTPKVGKTNHKLKAQRTVKQPKVTFSLFAPEAQEVLVAGDFSHWTEEPVSLKKHKGGIWKATLQLAPGVYEYKLGLTHRRPQGARRRRFCPCGIVV